MTQRLDLSFLEEFDARLRAIGAPVSGAWAPGCTDEEIDALLRPLGIDLPEEARLWWRWHNGTRQSVPITHREICTRIPLRIEDTAQGYAGEREAMHQLFGLTGLVVPFTEKPRIFFGCAGEQEEPGPVYMQNDIEAPRVILPSIRSLLDAWLQLFDVGAWEVRNDGLWHFHDERVPQHLLDLPI